MSKNSPFAKRLRFGSKLGLERIAMLCKRLGDPQLKYKTIHIAGTNGKGSTAAVLASVLKHNHYNVGLFTSPHLVDYRERFQVNGELISSDDLKAICLKVNQVMTEVERLYPQYGPFTEFEAAAAVGFVYFAEKQVDYAVFEVGLGGRLDATNVIMPEISIITSIGHDHLDRLGPTIRDVAGEKAGIIKANIPVISGLQLPEVDAVLEQTARRLNCEYYRLSDVNWQLGHFNLEGGKLHFPYFSHKEFEIKLLGKHQLENTAVALLALQILHKHGLMLNETDIRSGLAAAHWPGRLEVISKQPLLILDGAHNQEGIKALVSALVDLLPSKSKIAFIIGLSVDKNIGLIDPLIPLAKRMIFTESQNSRLGVTPAVKLRDYALSLGVQAESMISTAAALKAVAGEDIICICGSLYLIGDIKSLMLR